MSALPAVARCAADLRRWLFEDALPLWFAAGVDWRSGGFFEALSEAAEPVDLPRRTRVVGRQIYVFSVAHEMGWTGEAARAVEHGVAFLLSQCRAPDGLFQSSVLPDGTPHRAEFDLYDHAFALFGLAAAQGMVAAPTSDIACGVLQKMRQRFGHRRAGFEESAPPSLPLKANPHMHLLEASLAWMRTGVEAAPLWRELAAEIAGLAQTAFIDPRSGALREFFDADWRPARGEAGRLVEPGHQFEWAWLLLNWAAGPGCGAPEAAALRLLEIGETHGVHRARGLAINELVCDFSVKDAGSRLWQQTERVKAWAFVAARRQGAARDHALGRTAAAAAGLQQFLRRSRAGLWWDEMSPHGEMVRAPAKASSLYHIVGAIRELDRLVASQPKDQDAPPPRLPTAAPH